MLHHDCQSAETDGEYFIHDYLGTGEMCESWHGKVDRENNGMGWQDCVAYGEIACWDFARCLEATGNNDESRDLLTH